MEEFQEFEGTPEVGWEVLAVLAGGNALATIVEVHDNDRVTVRIERCPDPSLNGTRTILTRMRVRDTPPAGRPPGTWDIVY